jgi:hypothetical protein
MNLKKLVSYLGVDLLGPGTSSYKHIIYRAAVSQRLGNTALHEDQYSFLFVIISLSSSQTEKCFIGKL